MGGGRKWGLDLGVRLGRDSSLAWKPLWFSLGDSGQASFFLLVQTCWKPEATSSPTPKAMKALGAKSPHLIATAKATYREAFV